MITQRFFVFLRRTSGAVADAPADRRALWHQVRAVNCGPPRTWPQVPIPSCRSTSSPQSLET